MAQRNSPKQSSSASPHVGPARGGGPGARFMGEKQRPKNTRATILRIWSYLRRQRRGLIIAVLTIVVTTCLGLAGPYLMGRAIDDYILPGDMPGLARLSLILVGVYALTSLLTWMQAYVMAGVAQRTVRELRTDLFDKLQTLELRFFDQRPHGDTMSRLTNEVDNVNQVLTESVTQIASGILTGTGVVILMLILNPTLAVVSILSTVVLTFLLNR